MSKNVVPHKMVITYDNDGNFKKSVLLYRLKTNGMLDARKFYSMDTTKGLDKNLINRVVFDGKNYADVIEKSKG